MSSAQGASLFAVWLGIFSSLTLAAGTGESPRLRANELATPQAFAAEQGQSTEVPSGGPPAPQASPSAPQAGPLRPNILWLTSEDNGPHLGCYGDAYAETPHLDALAKRGLLYRHVWSNAPVCAPARTTIISGLYPTSTGAEHMRSMTRLPAEFAYYPELLRKAGYYCTNNNKQDYNLETPSSLWDDSSPRAHWKNRKPGQPFFAIFNFTVTHESQVRKRPHRAVHDPAAVRIPAYHPDTPQSRQDWAQYYDQLTEMDRQVGLRLAELAEAGLAEDTIIFYYGDHGPGLPRNKRWPYNSGLHVPLLLSIPAKYRELWPADYQPGGQSERLVSFVDLAPTLLSLSGTKPPSYYQGQAFAGPHATPGPDYLHGFRGRMDERYDLVRSIRDSRYVYIRNYMPHKIYGQHVSYMFETPTTQVWQQLHLAGKLTAAQATFWRPKRPEELYDLSQDPDEVHNLIDSPEHQAIRTRLSRALREQIMRMRDVGFLPEGEIHTRSSGSTPYELGRDQARYPLERIVAQAELASSLEPESLPALVAGLNDADSAVRYWSALGILMRGKSAAVESREGLVAALTDSSPFVRIAAAESLGRHGQAEDQTAALSVLLTAARVDQQGLFVSLAALNALDELDQIAAPAAETIRSLPKTTRGIPNRLDGYISRLLEHIPAGW